MGVSFDIIRNKGRLRQERDRACFGMLSCLGDDYGYESGEVKSIKFLPMHGSIGGWREWHNKVCADSWWSYLLSLPVMKDCVLDANLNPFKSGQRLFVEVSADIPADRLIQTLALFRVPQVLPYYAETFHHLVTADVDPDIAFVVSQAILTGTQYQPDLVNGVKIGAFVNYGWDNEHSVIAPRFFSVDDLKLVVNEFLTEDWENSFQGAQGVFSVINTYTRGYIESTDTSEDCLVRYLTPTGGYREGIAYKYCESKGIDLERSRTSQRTVKTIADYLEVADFVEGLINE